MQCGTAGEPRVYQCGGEGRSWKGPKGQGSLLWPTGPLGSMMPLGGLALPMLLDLTAASCSTGRDCPHLADERTEARGT